MRSKPKKILLLGASFTTRNMGVWALASGAITSACNSYPDAQVYLLDYNITPANYKIKHPGGISDAKLLNLRFSKKFWLPNSIFRLLLTALLIRVFPIRKVRDRLSARNIYLYHIQTADIITSIAGGDSFSDIYGISRLIYVALPQILVLLMDKPLILLPQTIGPFKSAVGRIIARRIIKSAWKIYSRDRESLYKVRDIVPDARKRMDFCYDMGFVLEPRIEEKRIPQHLVKHKDSDPIIGINVSGLLYMGGYTRKNMFGLKADYRRLILELIDHFFDKYNAYIMLIPHVIGSVENGESDTTACHEIYNESENNLREQLQIVSEEFDQHELKALIGYCDFFIGSRMHACIAALSQCVPAVGLAYSRKFRGVFASIGVEKLVFDLREHDHNYLIENVVQAFERRGYFRKQLKSNMPSVQASVMELFTTVSAECSVEAKIDVYKSMSTSLSKD